MFEIVLSAVFVVLLALCVDPLHLLIRTPVQAPALVLLIVAAVLYAGLLFRARPRDEREVAHLAWSSSAGYLVGVAGLSGVVIYQTISEGAPDKLVVVVLAAMVVSKLLLLLWNRRRR